MAADELGDGDRARGGDRDLCVLSDCAGEACGVVAGRGLGLLAQFD